MATGLLKWFGLTSLLCSGCCVLAERKAPLDASVKREMILEEKRKTKCAAVLGLCEAALGINMLKGSDEAPRANNGRNLSRELVGENLNPRFPHAEVERKHYDEPSHSWPLRCPVPFCEPLGKGEQIQ
ncbi:hypothetical protein EYF80_022279 [Liparis tanakae]|uniref:Uncharacterized protein n=1 Tax=Liparis tanakae TaxID=230148 RepID=A0A4Z2HR42_9TELE|nr:hypothetical protein EYF80_022279 [Liparis tanakae]